MQLVPLIRSSSKSKISCLVAFVLAVASMSAQQPDWLIKGLAFPDSAMLPTFTLTMIDEPSAVIDWYICAPVETYTEGDPLPNEATLLQSVEQTAVSEEEGMLVIQTVLPWEGRTETGQVWAVIQTPNHLRTICYDNIIFDGLPPTAAFWKYTSEVYYSGDTINCQPNMEVHSTTPIWIDYYSGDTGDTSVLLSTFSFVAPPYIRSVIYANPWVPVPSGNKQIWARVHNWAGSIDTDSMYVQAVDAEDVEIVNWRSAYNYLDPGNPIRVRLRLNGPTYGYTVDWYYGESGDTSSPATSTFPIDKIDFYMDVPYQQAKLWGRVNVLDRIIDSPTTSINPIAPSSPEILDPPDDIVRYPADSIYPQFLPPVTFVAVGGNLGILWEVAETTGHTGLVGRTTAPTVEDNEYLDFLTIPDGVTAITLNVQNGLGSATSRNVKVLNAGPDTLRAVNYPRTVRIRELDIQMQENGGPRMSEFWMQITCHPGQFSLFREGEEAMGPVLTGPPTNGNGSGHPSMDVMDQDLRTKLANLPTGDYVLKTTSNGFSVSSGTIHVINEILDPVQKPDIPAAYPFLHAGRETDGGVFNARVYVADLISPETLQVYAGPIGDYSRPLKFVTDLPDAFYQGNHLLPYGPQVFSLSWIPTKDRVYWMEARTYGDKLVRALLRRPLDSDKNQSESDVISILLPPGADEVPIPFLSDLPEVPAFTVSPDANFDMEIELPVRLRDMMASTTGFNLGQNAPGEIGTINVSVGADAPPLIMNPHTHASVVDGRVLWTADVLGDVNRTTVYYAAVSGEWIFLDEVLKLMQGGFPVPDNATRIKMVFSQDSLQSEADFLLNRIPQQLWNNMDPLFTYKDTVVTRSMGTFFELTEYPNLRHAELGWIYAFPLAGGLVYLGDIHPGRTDWNWMHNASYPAIFNFKAQSWVYYWINGYGWFWDFQSADWYRVN